MKNGWIKISRKIKEWQHYRNGYVLHVFIDLLTEAYPKQRVVKGRVIEAGQVVTSVAKIMSSTGIKSNHTVIDALQALVETGEIKRERSGNETIVTILNFGFYQGYAPHAQPSCAPHAQPTPKVMHDVHNKICTTCTTGSAPHAQPYLNTINSKESLKNIKETLTEESAVGPKIGFEKYGADGLVELKPLQYRSLIEQNHGDEQFIKELIEDLNNEIAEGSNPEVVNSKSHYHTLLKWINWRKNNKKTRPAERKINLNALKHD